MLAPRLAPDPDAAVPDTIAALVAGLQAVGDEEQVTRSAEQLADLARRDAAHREAIREAGGLNLLIPLLGAGDHKKMTEHAARAILNLLVSNQENRDRLREKKGVPHLVRLLRAGADQSVTKWATWAIANLANGKKEDEDCIREEGAIEPLVELLSCGPDKVVTEKAAKALADLAVNTVNKDAIREAGGIPPLVKLLSGGPDREGTKQATWALANLASKNDRNKDAIREAGGITALVPLLRMGPEQVVTEKATQALDNLAVTAKNKDAIREAGALEPLVELLSAGDNVLVTSQCAKCWADLLSANQKNRDKLRELGGVPPLIRLLCAGPDKDVTKWATWAISNLSNGRREDEDAIRDNKGIPLLVDLLDAGNDKVVTEKAAKALTDLAVNGVNKDVIRECGAVPKLVKLLSAGNTKEVTKQAAWCLSNLAGSNDANKLAILEADGVPPLVALLGSGPDKVVTEKAAKGLSNMATTAANRDAIREAGGLEPLVRLLGGGPDKPQTEQAAWAVANLGNCCPENQLRLASAGAVAKLLDLLGNSMTRAETKTRAAYGLLRLSEHRDNHSTFRAANAIEPLMRYMHENDGEGAAATAVTLAHLGGREENERLVATASVVGLLARRLKDRVKFDDPSKVLRLRDYVHALRLLTLNDNNKELIDTEGAVVPLVEILEADFQCTSSVKVDAAGALWNLAFCAPLRSKLVSFGIVPVMRSLAETARDPELRANAHGCLFTLGEIEASEGGFGEPASSAKAAAKAAVHAAVSAAVSVASTSSPSTSTAAISSPVAAATSSTMLQQWPAAASACYSQPSPTPSTAALPPGGLHVMLSYNWEYQSMMREVHSALQAGGWRVWMDVHEVRGSTLEAMASAVENAAVVVIAVSSSYKKSAHCRMEAEFAMMKRKPIVPVVVERGYQPDGWLGMLMGARFYHTLTDERDLERVVSALEADISAHVGAEFPQQKGPASLVSPPTARVLSDVARAEQQAGGASAEAVSELQAQNASLRAEVDAQRQVMEADRAVAQSEIEKLQAQMLAMQNDFASRMEAMGAELRALQANSRVEAKLDLLLAASAVQVPRAVEPGAKASLSPSQAVPEQPAALEACSGGKAASDAPVATE